MALRGRTLAAGPAASTRREPDELARLLQSLLGGGGPLSQGGFSPGIFRGDQRPNLQRLATRTTTTEVEGPESLTKKVFGSGGDPFEQYLRIVLLGPLAPFTITTDLSRGADPFT